jgi:phosphoglycolate phosphatase
VIHISYGGFKGGIKGNPEKMKEAFESALSQAEEIFRKECKKNVLDHKTLFAEDNEILVLSKSIGTAVAAAFQQKHSFVGKNIYFTPVKQSFLFMQPRSGIVFHGTADPWAQTEDIREGCDKLHLPLYITEGTNHSMETGDCLKDLQIMQEIMEHCNEYLGS